MNIATDTYEGQIVAILTNDTYVAYIVNKRGDAYYVSKLDEGNADVNYDALGNRPIYNLVGTLDKFVIVSELSDGVYKIRGQYKICLGDATVYSSANDNFFLVGHSDGVATIRKITSSDIFDYTLWIMPSLLNLAFQQEMARRAKICNRILCGRKARGDELHNKRRSLRLCCRCDFKKSGITHRSTD